MASKTTRITFITLPNGIQEEIDNNNQITKKFRFSIYNAIRLEHDHLEPLPLALFKKVANWIDTVKELKFRLKIKKESGDIFSLELGEPVTHPSFDGQIWSLLFKPSLEVHSFEYKDFSERRIRSYPVSSVANIIRNIYENFARDLKTAIEPPEIDFANESIYNQLVIPTFPASGSDDEIIQKGFEDHLKRHRYYNPRDLTNSQQQYKAYLDFLQVKKFIEPMNQSLDAHKSKYNQVTITKPKLDFHKRLAAVSQHPFIMRLCGLVLDFAVQIPDELADPGDCDVWVIPQITEDAEDEENMIYVCPKTRCNTGLRARPREEYRNPALDSGYLELNNDKKYSVVQFDVLGSAIKVMNNVYNLYRQLKDTDKREGKISFPYIQSLGLGITYNERAADLFKSFQCSKNIYQEITNAQEGLNEESDIYLYLEDMTPNLRLDVFTEVDAKWRSLHKRISKYSFIENGFEIIDENREGYITPSLTQSADGYQATEGEKPDLMVDEMFCMWQGWSLSVPEPGAGLGPNSISEEYNRESIENKEQGMIVGYKVARGSLPPLLYGKTNYSFACRLVDLAGNSVPLSDMGHNLFRTKGVKYLDLKQMNSPFLVPRRSLEDLAGESLLNLGVRTENKTPEYDLVVHTTDDSIHIQSERHVLPKDSSVSDAICYGVFSENGKLQKEAYHKIIARNGRITDTVMKDLETGLETEIGGPDGVEIVEKSGERDGVIIRNYAVHHEKNCYIPFITDHLSAGVTFVNLPGSLKGKRVEFREDGSVITEDLILIGDEEFDLKEKNTSITRVMFGLKENGFDKNPFILNISPIILDRVPGEIPQPIFDTENRILRVYLAQSQICDVKFSSCFKSIDDAKLLGVYDWIFSGVNEDDDLVYTKKMKEIIKDGRNRWVSSSTTIRLVHALLNPLGIPQLEILNMTREYNKTFADFKCNIKIHKNSSERFDIVVKYSQQEDNLSESGPRIVPIRAHSLERSIQYENKDLDENTPPLPQPGVKMNDVDIDFRHEFGSTKYYDLTLEIIATTRFKEYFENKNMNELTRRSEISLIVPSTARPQQPKLFYQIPCIERKKEALNFTRFGPKIGVKITLHGGITYKINRPLWTSGMGEKLAAIVVTHKQPTSARFITEESNIVNKIIPVPKELENVIFRWGLDPISDLSKQVPISIGPSIDNFINAVEVESRLTLDEINNGQHGDFGNFQITAVGHDIFFDENERLYYSSFILKQPNNVYRPFVQSNLAIYQKHGLKKDNRDVKLSKLEKTDMVRLMPQRTVIVTKSTSIEGYSAPVDSRTDPFTTEEALPVLTAKRYRIQIKGTRGSVRYIDKQGNHSVENNEISLSIEAKMKSETDLDWKVIDFEIQRIYHANSSSDDNNDIIWDGHLSFHKNLDMEYRITYAEFEMYPNGKDHEGKDEWKNHEGKVFVIGEEVYLDF